jgi:hypothetical protein
LTGTVPKDAYVWIYNNTTVIDQFQVAAGSSTFERTLPSPLATGTYNLSIKVAENSTVTEPNRSQASNVLQVIIANTDSVNLAAPQNYAGRISETLVVSGDNSVAGSTLVIDWSVSPPAMTKTGTGTVEVDAVNDKSVAMQYYSDAGTTRFTTNVGQPPITGVQAGITNWSVHARKPGASTSTIEFAASQNLALLSVSNGALAAVATDGNRVIAVNTLSIATGGTLDMNDNDMIIRASAATKNAVHAAAQANITSAQNGVDAQFISNWNGTGITSSRARAQNVTQGFDLYNLGVIRNSDLSETTGTPFTTWHGQDVGLDDVLLKFTYTGDGNLDGAITFDDYSVMDAAFFGLLLNLGWATGDINNDGVITFDDYSIVDQAFFFQLAPL